MKKLICTKKAAFSSELFAKFLAAKNLPFFVYDERISEGHSVFVKINPDFSINPKREYYFSPEDLGEVVSKEDFCKHSNQIYVPCLDSYRNDEILLSVVESSDPETHGIEVIVVPDSERVFIRDDYYNGYIIESLTDEDDEEGYEI